MITREQVLQVAKTSYGWDVYHQQFGVGMDELVDFAQRIAAIAAAEEREACAKACGEYARQQWQARMWDRSLGGDECSVAIRARSQPK